VGNHEKTTTDNQRPGPVSNQVLIEHKYETLPLEMTCAVNVTFEQIECNYQSALLA
jgi:hypothetical protein